MWRPQGEVELLVSAAAGRRAAKEEEVEEEEEERVLLEEKRNRKEVCPPQLLCRNCLIGDKSVSITHVPLLWTSTPSHDAHASTLFLRHLRGKPGCTATLQAEEAARQAMLRLGIGSNLVADDSGNYRYIGQHYESCRHQSLVDTLPRGKLASPISYIPPSARSGAD